jgi:acyl-CoA synthetase (AMP-forming)/AMP-acid ligase II
MLEHVADSHGGVRVHFPGLGTALTVAELRERSARVAQALRRRGLSRGEVVGLLVPTAPEFLTSFFGISIAGAAVAPLPLPPGAAAGPAHWSRLSGILAAAGIRRVVLSAAWNDHSVRQALGEDVIAWTPESVSECDDGPADGHPAPQDVALVQHTSGSTARPRGVVLSHARVVAGIKAIIAGARLSSSDVACQWLPLFHDMGLVGLLSFIASGAEMHVWSPAGFLRRPDRWLRHFAAVGGSLYTGPDFSFAHLRDAIPEEEVPSLDLRRWRIAFNGGEPIGPSGVQAFIRHFAAAGFRPEAMYPVYGLAEATLAVTFPDLGEVPRIDCVDREVLARKGRALPAEGAAARGVVCVGRPLTGLELRIEGAPEGHVGEILVRGPSVASDGWLRTGDLGYLRDGRLYVTGRKKQMIVINGTNYYPEDVEALARDAEGLFRRRRVAVALSDQGGERMALLAESLSLEPAALAGRLHRRLTAGLGLYAVDVHVVRKNTLRRTTSGKYQRLLMRDLLAQQALAGDVLASFP